MIRHDLEEGEDLVEHLAVLRRDADDAGQVWMAGAERLDDRRHLDRFRAGAEN